jgi:hypothetical protein
MNWSLVTADRATHLRIVCFALIWGIAVTSFAVAYH